ncbi:septation protein spoVG [bacterium]|nr:MAG: septation protein spoVG [bacterium]
MDWRTLLCKEVIRMPKVEELEVVRIYRFAGDSKIKAFVDVDISGFVVKGLRIMEGKNGLFLGMPQEKAKDGKWYSVVYPTTKEAKKQLSDLVIAAYNENS